jgi:hypothetical protein
MKQITKILSVALVMFAFSATTFAQLSATASASAVIISPLRIVKVTDLHFGTIMKGTLASTVVLTPAGVRSIGSGDATLSAIAPASAVASFTITGEPTLSYTINLPAAPFNVVNGGNNMSVGTFVSSPAAGVNSIPAGGSQTLTVGATLSVGAAQVSGTYTANLLTVTVNYN